MTEVLDDAGGSGLREHVIRVPRRDDRFAHKRGRRLKGTLAGVRKGRRLPGRTAVRGISELIDAPGVLVVRPPHIDTREQAREEPASGQLEVRRCDGRRQRRDQRRKLGRSRIEPRDDGLRIADHVGHPLLPCLLRFLECVDVLLGRIELPRQGAVLGPQTFVSVPQTVIFVPGDVPEERAFGIFRRQRPTSSGAPSRSRELPQGSVLEAESVHLQPVPELVVAPGLERPRQAQHQPDPHATPHALPRLLHRPRSNGGVIRLD